MIKEAIEKINELDHIKNHLYNDIDGMWSDRNIKRVKPPEHTHPEPIETATLTGMKDFITHCRLADRLFLHVASHKEVYLTGGLQPYNDNSRFIYAGSQMNLDSFQFGKFMDLETFIVSLQSHFVPTQQVEAIINHLGNLASENVRENKDDGFSQSIQVRVGIRMKSEVKIENPMKLQPWRTFREVTQPESDCILRLREQGNILLCGLFVADGNVWQLEAVENIKAWLANNIPDFPVIG